MKQGIETQQHWSQAVRYARRFLPPHLRHLAEDAVQSAWTRLAIAEPDLLKETGALLQAVRWAALDIGRHERRLEHPPPRQLSPFEARVRVSPETREHLSRLLLQLDPAPRRLIYMVYFDGLTYAEIAAILGISKQAVYRRHRRALRRLRGLR